MQVILQIPKGQPLISKEESLYTALLDISEESLSTLFSLPSMMMGMSFMRKQLMTLSKGLLNS
ncbi:hypothetical protein [uncultured Shewanella sp.]|uniref:hypothetical protein n=1 Tax=uncultured Shewanella sp. TaxID=173975 RepID=UPI002635CFC7|nr:hypothetical protein [uncultured Shewanella sp.]